ncbi:DNA primase [Prevotella nigrescens]|uniref:DNA primase n=1 Tax=Prevotella nigrescens TaxID=28133 RepID=UPI0028ED0A94|nr:DNA primase [Prevotella nigrescens]
MIDRPTVDRILEAANIVDVISEYVSLRKAGTSYKGLCPFHDDRTPSFSVSPAKGVYKCFSCGEAGNVVNFIMKHDQMTYPEALKVLAKKYGIEVKERELTTEEKQLENERESMFLVNEWAAKYFQNILHNHVDGKAIGLQYFRNRGFRDDIIEKFQLGFCLPGKQEFANAALKASYKAEFLVKTGLCFERENGELADRFNGRVIFPWLNVSGKVIAFGGRLLDSRTKGISQKYVNSPGSEIYQKDHALYGIYQAKKAIAKFDLVYMVEGYTDVVSMHQCGIENVVANSGTALSVYQIKLLRRFTSNIVLLYDGDEAGQHAALRGTDMLLSEGMNVKVLLLPDGKDPDELARNLTAEAFRKYIEENQTDFIVFKINVLLRGITDPVKRSEAINSIVQSIAVIKDPILRDTYLRECAHRTGMKENTLIAQMNRFIYNDREQQRKEQVREAEQTVSEEQVLRPATPMQQASKVETMLVQAIVRDGEKIIIRNVLNDETGEKINLNVAQYIAYDLGLDNLSFKNPLSVQILTEAIEHSGDENFKAEEYFTHHPDILISTLAVKLSVDRFQLSESMQMKEREIDLRDRIMHLILDYRMDYVEQHLKELQASLSAESDLNKVMEIMGEIKKMQDMRNVLARKLGNDIVV